MDIRDAERKLAEYDARQNARKQLLRDLKVAHRRYVNSLRAAFRAENELNLVFKQLYDRHVGIDDAKRQVGITEQAPYLSPNIVDYLERHHE